MPTTDWANLFEVSHPEPPLPAELIDLVSASVAAPLDEGESKALADGGDVLPELFEFPTHPLPASYLSFLAWSNGGLFVNGDREFGMLGGGQLREYMLTYHTPYKFNLPGAVPFALDGGGNFYLFDLRQPPDAAGEYPVLFAGTGGLTFAAAVRLPGSFADVCRGRTDPTREGESR